MAPAMAVPSKAAEAEAKAQKQRTAGAEAKVPKLVLGESIAGSTGTAASTLAMAGVSASEASGSETASEQGDLAPQQGDLPPQQGDRPPQQGDLPPQQGDLPPQQGDFPQQQGDLLPQQGERVGWTEVPMMSTAAVLEESLFGGSAQEAARRQEADDIEEDAELDAWKRCIDQGVDIRSKHGQRFSRAVDGGKSAEYKVLTTMEKQAFRKSWAKCQFEKAMALKTKEKSWRKVDISKGSYLPLSVIIREEGADDDAIKASYEYIKACWAMGGLWRKFNKMTKRMEWLYMRQEVHEIYEESWRLYEEYHDKQRQPTLSSATDVAAATFGAGAATAGAGGAGAATARAKAATAGAGASGAGKNGAGASGAGKKRKASGDDPEQPHLSPRQPRSPLDAAFAAAMNTKKLYQATNSKANLVSENIRKGARGWEGFAGHWGGQLAETIGRLDEATNTGFNRDFLTMDPKDIKAKHDQADLLIQVSSFSRVLDPLVDSCQRMVARLLRMHAEAMA